MIRNLVSNDSDKGGSIICAGVEGGVNDDVDDSSHGSKDDDHDEMGKRQRKEKKIYSISQSGAIHEHDMYASSGSGSGYVTAYCDAELDHQQEQHRLQQQPDFSSTVIAATTTTRKEMSEEECISFVRKAFKVAVGRDNSSGGKVRLWICSKDGIRFL